MSRPILLLLAIVAAALAPGPPPVNPSPVAGGPTRLTLKNGTVYVLREPPRISGRRIVFTTTDGRVFTMDQSEIEAVGAVPKPTATPQRYDIGDSRALGAIARQQRDREGRRAEVAPRAAVRRPTRTPRPRPRPSPSAAASGKTSRG